MAGPPAPVARRVDTPAWTIQARAERGRVRKAMEDAVALLPDVPCAWMRCDAVGVFDGVGGMPHGGAAAQAAADGLGAAVAGARGTAEVLPLLDRRVGRTGGATTAVVALLPHGAGPVHVLWAGDSSAYAVSGGEVRPLTVPDSEDGFLRQCLGLQGVAPHETRTSLGPGAALLLCSDGVDGVLGAAGLPALLGRGLDGLLDAVAAAGAPDNATAVLARRR